MKVKFDIRDDKSSDIDNKFKNNKNHIKHKNIVINNL